MKAILEFNLPEEDSEHNIAINGLKYYSALFTIDQNMRSILKHGHSYKSVEELAEAVRDMIPELEE